MAAGSEHDSILRKFGPEIFMGGSLIIAAVIMRMIHTISEETSWIIGTITATISLSAVLIKLHFEQVAQSLAKRYWPIDSKVGTIGAILEKLSGRDFEHASRFIDEVLEKLEVIPKGKIPLDEHAYYDELLSAVAGSPKGTRISAVSLFDIGRWSDDPRQRNYLQANFSAAKRGVHIHRVFVIERNAIDPRNLDAVRAALSDQVSNGIQVSIAWMEQIRANRAFHEDFILIEKGSGQLFLDYIDPLDPTRVLRGELVTDADQVERYRHTFEKLLHYATDFDQVPQLGMPSVH